MDTPSEFPLRIKVSLGLEDPRDGRVGYVVLTGAGRRRAKEGVKTLARLLGRLTLNLLNSRTLHLRPLAERLRGAAVQRELT